MKLTNRFVSPGAWFAMNYPADWIEAEDQEETFLFYNPSEWSGNFRISVYQGRHAYGETSVQQELKNNPDVKPVKVGKWLCAYTKEMFEEDGNYYTSHLWLLGQGDLLFECSFAVNKGASPEVAEEIIASLEVRDKNTKYPAEIIPVRVSEICLIDESYEWVSKKVKETLAQDFQGQEEDVQKMQELVNKSVISSKNREAWLAMGITLCVILTNEVDGVEWRTLIDGNREAPVLLHIESGEWIDPMKLAWSKVKAGKTCNLIETYQELL